MEGKMPMDKLIEKVDGSKYTLVVTAAKRARMITEGDDPRVISRSNKPVTVALQEIAADKVKWERTKSGIK
ncbi:MAG: DNA-directed RNA polymerase subunit omega [Firmicutes bacterium]|nr:DNA-directed RNA polymerase subunit omega [Bacillota bacterium]